MTDSNTRDYRETLFLPKTGFPMRAGLPKKEPEWLDYWDEIDLYGSLRQAGKGREKYILHDGPPYANGHIHMGTALNKILKDIITRTHQMMGYDSNYVPGWDCHGLPIEWRVEEEFRAGGRTKDQVPAPEFRTRCREYASEWLDVQRQEFKRLGVIGDWDHPYMTMKYESEAAICHELLKIAGTGQLYRGSKPVMWSPVERTALAEAEVEYADRSATQIYVKFPVKPAGMVLMPPVGKGSGKSLPGFENANVVIWTTTPWTIPANRAVCYSNDITYGIYEVTGMKEAEFEPWSKPGDRLIVADALWPNVAKASLIKSAERLSEVSEHSFTNMTLSHPLSGMKDAEGKFDFDVPLFAADHVTAEAGTGFVHTAPSHGDDDFAVWTGNQKRLEELAINPAVPITLDDNGCYTNVLPERFQGLDVIRISGKKRGQDGKANAEVIRALMETGNILARGVTMLRDAHSWRSKAPVIRRATPQWFISMSKAGLRDKALAAIENTTFWPKHGKNRLRAMVGERPDWLISRQRNWGVPITLLVNTDGKLHTELAEADVINERILAIVRKHGVDGWFDADIKTLMGDVDVTGWEKVTDILDVWFDSGSTHAFCLKQREDLKPRADLYMEGSDQHRGWFQSSLLESCAVYGEAPYDGILTHGFVMAEDGRKMSKSLGNTVEPEQIIRQFGADIMRLWVASSDFTEDLRIGDEIIRTNVDAYRKLRNTLRYMLGTLDGYDESDAVSYEHMPNLEKWVLHRLHTLEGQVRTYYHEHDYKRITSALFNFCTNDLSTFYFDIRKDALYCDPLQSTRRRACRTVMDMIFHYLTRWLAPILCFTMEEVWYTRFGKERGSVHIQEFPETPEGWRDEHTHMQMGVIKVLRDDVYAYIEPMRADGKIGSTLEAGINIRCADSKLKNSLEAFGLLSSPDANDPTDTLADYFIVSEYSFNLVKVKPGTDMLAGANEDETEIDIDMLANNPAYKKCARSWKYFRPERDDRMTPRDKIAVEQWDKMHG